MDKETYYRLALIHFPNYGNANIKKLIKICGSATAMFEETKVVASKLSYYRANIQLPKIDKSIHQFVNNELQQAYHHGIKICFFDGEDYPERLKNCSDSPYYFYYKGESCFNKRKSIAIVGTRNASNYGKDVVKKLVEDLAPHDVSIISGLARGIDTCAHEAALQRNLTTVAVLGCGLSMIYPSENIKLAQQILEQGGALVSEYPYDTMPDRMNFPKRNRVIAGLADAVVVAESQEKGGSIITAEIAHSYNRDVFAVPGSIFQKSQSGCHELIRNNSAALVSSGKDIIEMMNWDQAESKSQQTTLFPNLSVDEEAIIDILREEQGATVDKIAEKLPGFNSSQIASLLLNMELKGAIECKPGKVYTTIY
jgi:DNA processing protein